MAINARATVVALKKETTEGTLVLPTGTSSYIPIEDDFKIEPAFSTLQNAELFNSLGAAKPIQGLENPTCSLSLYLKHSGTSGSAPGYGSLLEAAFGEFDDAGVEHDTVSSSTTSVINVDVGEGATYQKGQLLIVQDGTNGYSIRPVYSISSDALTLAFNLSNAPASGVLLGEAIMYRPANTGHTTLSLIQYLGNGGAVEAMAGGRVTDVSIKFTAGDLINASYTIAGTKYFFNPIDITSSTKYMDFNDGSVRSCSVTVQTYTDPQELASALQTAMQAQTADTITVSYSNSTGKFTITSNGSTLSLKFATGANTANTIATKLGYTATDKTAALTYTGTNTITLTSPYTPVYDSVDPLVAKNNQVLIGDATDTTCFAASEVDFSLSMDKADILSVCSTSGKSSSVFSKRTAKINVVALLPQYDVDKFERYRGNTNLRFMYAFGEKSGGNWVKGKSGAIYSPTMTITGFSVETADGLATLHLELTAYVNSSGDPEIFLGFV